MKKKFLSLLLFACMLVTSACQGTAVVTEEDQTADGSESLQYESGESDTAESESAYDADSADVTESDTQAEAETEELANEEIIDAVNSHYAPTIPEDLRFDGGEIHFLGMEHLVEGYNGTEDAPVSAISQELYDRNRRCEERFGVELKFTNIQTDWANYIPNAVRTSVLSGSHNYDIVFATQSVQLPLINNGYYLPISEYDIWIDLEQPWWNKGYIEGISLNSNELYALYGHLTYNQVERTSAVFANVTKLSEYHGITADDLFELVMNGEWTLDKFTELVNLGYRDLKQNNEADEGDMFGLVECLGKDFVAYGAGVSFTKRDENGYPVLDVKKDSSLKLVDKLIALFNNDNVIYLSNAEHLNYFGDGNALFVCNRLFVAGWVQLREMKDDFVILPYPKLDKTVDGYHAVVENNVQIGCVMNMVWDSDLEMISAVLEQMCYDGYKSVTPLYLDELTSRFEGKDYADKQDEVIDMIIKGARTDFLYANGLSGLKDIFTSCVTAGKNDFETVYDSKRESALNALNRLIDTYKKNKL